MYTHCVMLIEEHPITSRDLTCGYGGPVCVVALMVETMAKTRV